MAQTQHTFKLHCDRADCFLTVEGRGRDHETAKHRAEDKIIRHKIRSDAHDYCVVCNLDFGCFDDLVKHKAEAPDNLHISCPWCGQDFKSHSGRNAHIAQVRRVCQTSDQDELTCTYQSHPKDQDIKCFGCGEHFARTAAFVCHLEEGLCKTISSKEFMSHVRHKHFTYKALEAPGSAIKWDVKALQDKAAEDLEPAGGVLLDLGGSIDSTGLQQPLEPQKREFKVGPNVVEHFPPLSARKAGASSSHASAVPRTLTSESENNGEEWEEKLAGVSLNDLEARRKDGDLNLDPTPADAAAGKGKAIAWSAGADLPESLRQTTADSTKAMIQPDMRWEDRFALKEAEDNQGNMMTDVGIANPDHADFQADRFFNQITETYECPWAGCEKSCDSVPDLRTHLREDHEAGDPRCPDCQKKFKSLHALVAHCEAVNGRCRVKHTKDYSAFIHRITGGFVNATAMKRDDIPLKQDVAASKGVENKKIDIPFIKYVAQAPEGLRTATGEQGQPQFTQVSGNNVGWIPPHKRAGLMR